MADELLQSPLGIRLRAVLDAMDGDVVRALADLGVTDYRSRFSAVVRAVADRGPLSIRDLAATLGVTHSAASQSVAAMRERGLVDQAPGADARSRIVTLTTTTLAMKPALDAEWAATEVAYDRLNAELTASLALVVDEMTAALATRSFRDRIADAAADLPGISPAHRAALTRRADG